MDWLAASALALAALVFGVAVDRASDTSVSLPRAAWACAKTHAGSEVMREPLPEGGSVARLVSVPVCDAWVRR